MIGTFGWNGCFFEIARKQNTLNRTLEDVKKIARLFAIRKLAYLLREPKIPAQRKETAIRQELADKLLPTSLNLALLVVQRELVDLILAESWVEVVAWPRSKSCRRR